MQSMIIKHYGKLLRSLIKMIFTLMILPTCKSIQHGFELTEEDPKQVMGIVEENSIGTGGPPSVTVSCEGECDVTPRKNTGLSSSSVLLPMTSCLAIAEHRN